MIKEERARARRKKQNIRRTLIAVGSLVVLLGALFLVARNGFRVKNVVVEGNELYEDDVITTEVLNDKYSWNALWVFFKYKFKKPQEVPFIDTLEISLDNPHTVHITVYEKGIMGYLGAASEGQNVYFDKDGFVVEISDRIIKDVPEIKGLAVEEVTLYQKLSLDAKLLDQLLTLTQALKRSELIPDSIIFGQTGSPILTYDEVWVRLGSDDDLTMKLAHLEKILPKLAGESGVLHLEDWTENSESIVFDRDEP